jgi:hypothetical protein
MQIFTMDTWHGKTIFTMEKLSIYHGPFHHGKQQFTMVKWDIFFNQKGTYPGFSPGTLDSPRTPLIFPAHTGFSPPTLDSPRTPGFSPHTLDSFDFTMLKILY